MEAFITAVAAAFAAGFAVQRLLEIIDPLFGVMGLKDQNKKLVLALIALVVGMGFAGIGGLRVMAPLGAAPPDVLDLVVTGLVVSAGTEGFNSISKFLGYAKEEKKADVQRKADKTEAAVDSSAG